MTNENKKQFSYGELIQYHCPGVLKVECIPEKRAYFANTLNVLFEIKNVISQLEAGTFENQDLLHDFEKYGREGLYVSVVVFGVEYVDEEKRKAALVAAKAAWEGELY